MAKREILPTRAASSDWLAWSVIVLTAYLLVFTGLCLILGIHALWVLPALGPLSGWRLPQAAALVVTGIGAAASLAIMTVAGHAPAEQIAFGGVILLAFSLAGATIVAALVARRLASSKALCYHEHATALVQLALEPFGEETFSRFLEQLCVVTGMNASGIAIKDGEALRIVENYGLPKTTMPLMASQSVLHRAFESDTFVLREPAELVPGWRVSFLTAARLTAEKSLQAVLFVTTELPGAHDAPALSLLLPPAAHLLRQHRALSMKSEAQRMLDQSAFPLVWCLTTGEFEYTNDAAAALLGYSPTEFKSMRISDVWPEHSPEQWSDLLASLQRARSVSREIWVTTRQRHRLRLAMLVSYVERDEGPIISIHARDVTAEHAETAMLRESHDRLKLIVDAACPGHWEWDLVTNNAVYSKGFIDILGLTESDVAPRIREWMTRVHREDYPKLKSDITAHLKGTAAAILCSHRVRHRDGIYRWVLCRGLAARDESGKVVRLAGSLEDVTDRISKEEGMVHDAFHDHLTGLANRARFVDHLQLNIDRQKRAHDRGFAVLCVDLDRFKVIVDGLGHSAADRVLQAAAQRLLACVRPGDTVARLSGDEFAVLLSDINEINDATRIADRVQKDLRQPVNLTSNEVFTSVSVGIVISTVRYTHAEDLLRDAETAMHRAKGAGGGRREVFDDSMQSYAVDRYRLETDLRGAIERQEFRVFYQPIVDLNIGKISGFEALVRWQHPQRGLVSPIDFIAIAEETGLISQLGKWVLNEACRQIRCWHLRFPGQALLTISVNLSSRQFSNELPRQVAIVLEETGLSPELLHLEITESVLIDNVLETNSVLNSLKTLNVKLELDDFGTGYSSLSYLHRFPIDNLKIDRSFIQDHEIDENGEIVKTIVNLAKNLKMDVTAEGIEDELQLQNLRGLDCKYGQGYLFSRPLDSRAAEALLEQDPLW